MKEDYSEMIREIRSGNREPLHTLYVAHRQSFVEWAGAKFRCGEEEARDIFQEVMLIFYENVTGGKIEQLRSHIRTYLFGIGRLLILQHFRKAGRETDWPGGEEGMEQLPDEVQVGEHMELSERQEILRRAIHHLGDKCRQLLTLFYYHRYPTEAIMQALSYKNPDVVKSQKVRCMKSLREIISNQFDLDTL
ncbi:MAG: sigma-70 family RNA polymerase sigma factor [Bacteroidetes bacterium]|nr:MAG: sigma-70 family RNA polymerase sigma factor [Bacteroidota bacterium]